MLNRCAVDADDLTQNVFTVLSEKWDTLEKTNIGAWIFGVARRKLYEYYREKKKTTANIVSMELLKTELTQYDQDNDTYFLIDDETINKIKDEILDMLSDDERELYEEYFVKGVPYEIIMQIYSISYSAATSKVNRLKEKINHCISVKSASLLSFGLVYSAITLSLMSDLLGGR